jgi:hypothetical protein
MKQISRIEETKYIKTRQKGHLLINNHRYPNYKQRKKRIPTFLDGARKVAKEPLAKFNAREESRSLMYARYVLAR